MYAKSIDIDYYLLLLGSGEKAENQLQVEMLARPGSWMPQGRILFVFCMLCIYMFSNMAWKFTGNGNGGDVGWNYQLCAFTQESGWGRLDRKKARCNCVILKSKD